MCLLDIFEGIPFPAMVKQDAYTPEAFEGEELFADGKGDIFTMLYFVDEALSRRSGIPSR
jgi:hypothetical protein